MTERPYFDIFIGDKDEYATQDSEYQATAKLLEKNGHIYGFPGLPEQVSSEQQDILKELSSEPLRFEPPPPLLAGRIIFTLDQSPGLAKTRANFLSLCKGDKGMCKNAPTKALHYLNVPIHRVVKGFVAQGGDITRLDGSGGESIYGGKSFNDEKDGLKKKFALGTLAMANSGKNSNTSQFFLTLTTNETKLAKLNGKYVIFGEVDPQDGDGLKVLDRIDAVAADGSESPTRKIWIGGCGVIREPSLYS